ncbi:MAG: glycosyltransferase [Candidatus Omnitrophica bacterium]|nr:glycosyltransferase [Candidatus Omnitrophota bacterium]
MRLSVIIPARNEADNIVNLLNKIETEIDTKDELVIVDDHSTDSTYALVDGLSRQYTNIKLVRNIEKAGFANALKTGFNNVSGDVVIPVMADCCDDLSVINKMRNKMEEGYDVVCGCRYIKGGARLGGSRLKGFFSFLAGRSLQFLLGLPTSDITNAFKMYKKKVIDNIEIKSNAFEVSMEIPLKAYFAGFKIADVPTVWRERTKGKSTFKMFRLLPDYLKLYLWAIWKKLNRLSISY